MHVEALLFKRGSPAHSAIFKTPWKNNSASEKDIEMIF